MKQANKAGPAVLGRLPEPRRLSAAELRTLTRESAYQIVDTRLDRNAVLGGHIPGSFYAPLNRTFPTVTGSFLNPEAPVVLLVDEGRLDEAVRDLVRIGIDHVHAWAPAALLNDVSARRLLSLASIESIDYTELERRRRQGTATILDVRGASEHAARCIEPSINIPHTRLRVRAAELGEPDLVYVHCLSGARASVSAVFLARLGIHAVHVDGHFSSWRSESYEMGEAQ